MLPDRAPQDAFDRLRTLPFVETARDGLFLHDTMRESIAASLKATDPQTHRRYRQLAWHRLRDEVRGVSADDLWRYTADLLYLIENPIVREAFFPTTAHAYIVDRARADDWPAIQGIMRVHESSSGAGHLELWWARQPDTFRAVRDQMGALVGFNVVVSLDALDDRLLNDPLILACKEDLQQHPVPKGQRVLIDRRWLGRDAGEGPSQFLSTCWLDLKRMYMEASRSAARLHLCRGSDTVPACFEQAGVRSPALACGYRRGEVLRGQERLWASLD